MHARGRWTSFQAGPRNGHLRRGSALMVALAMLIMLAVFAGLFLVSSRFDMEASAANVDYVRLDLYAEGLAQYIQLCLVMDLWGTDDKPLNYDDDGSGAKVPRPGSVPMSQQPGPDNPYDYFGGAVPVDPDGTPGNADDYVCYPDFWLTDPRVQRDPMTADLVYLHPAFAPGGIPSDPALPPYLTGWPPFYIDPATLSQQDRTRFWWRWADLDGDGRADAPWLFYKDLGDGVYLRAAVRIEDTSSRININVADEPLFVDAASVADPESFLRRAVYPGYPSLADPDGNSLFTPFLLYLHLPPAILPVYGEYVGRFLSELNLLGAVKEWLVAAGYSDADADAYSCHLNRGRDVDADGTPDLPGRYGLYSARCLPYESYSNAAGLLPPDELQPLLGDTARGNPGRLGNALARLLSGGMPWDPLNPATWQTYDPDALSRRASTPASSGISYEQDRPFGVEDTFDLMSLFGIATDLSTGRQRYAAGGALPVETRLERLWRDLLVNDTDSRSVQWRRLLTSYSWSLNICPYGEDPCDDGSFRKVNLNTCSGDELKAALEAADRHRFYGNSFAGYIRQFVANFLDFRDYQFNPTQLAYYLCSRWRAGGTDVPPPLNAKWNPGVWQNYWNVVKGYDTEQEYLTWLFSLLSSDPSGFWTEIENILEAGVSIDKPEKYNGVLGLERHPYIVEVWMNIQYPDDVTVKENDPDGTPNSDDEQRNNYAVELYNPWDTPFFTDGWYLRVEDSAADHEVEVDLSGHVIPPGGRLVVSRLGTGAPLEITDSDLVIAVQGYDPNGAGPTVKLVYKDGTDEATYDSVGGAWTREFSGDAVSSDVVPAVRSIVRRDDAGFWCYQMWAEQFDSSGNPIGTLGSPNSWYGDLDGDGSYEFMRNFPWDPTVYGPNIAVPVIDVGLLLSPADLVLIPYDVPEQAGGGSSTLADAITPFDRLQQVLH